MSLSVSAMGVFLFLFGGGGQYKLFEMLWRSPKVRCEYIARIYFKADHPKHAFQIYRKLI